MTKRGVTRVKASDWKAKKEDEGAVEIEMDDGSVWRIPPPQLWSDEALEATKGETDPVALATALVGGPEKYAEFKALGGSAAMVLAICEDVHGMTVGESRASSSS